MKLKKFLAIAMSAALAMTALTACGSKTDDSKSSDKKTVEARMILRRQVQGVLHQRRLQRSSRLTLQTSSMLSVLTRNSLSS